MDQLLKKSSVQARQKRATKSDAARERIEREIKVMDEQIDALVYELYGLTEEEIKIVET